MFVIPAPLTVDEFASTSPVDIKSAIDAALADLPMRRAGEVCMAVAAGNFGEATTTLAEYAEAERVLRKISMILDETIKHGGTGKPVAAAAPASVTTTDYELPEMPTRPVASTAEEPEPIKAEPTSELMKLVAATSSAERRTRKRA